MMSLVRSLACTLLLSAFTLPALAEGYRHDHREAREHWHGDIRHFHEHDIARWREGRWVHGFHEGRQGWWWTVGPTWYWYAAPIYPYPDPYQPPMALAPAEPIPSPPAANMVQPPGGYWYYCRDSGSYYPYIAQCRTPWERVPATP